MTSDRISSLEILEDRIAPAGIITLEETAPGVFTISGDALGNEIDVYAASPGNIRFEPGFGTTLNLVGTGAISSFTTGKLTSLTADLNAGNDTLRITNINTLKELDIDGGDDADNLVFTNLGVKGDVTLGIGVGEDQVTALGLSTDIKGNLLLTAVSDNKFINLLADNTTIGGRFTLVGGTGEENIEAGGSGTFKIGKGLELNSGAAVGATVSFGSMTETSIGKLPTGESLLVTGSGGMNAFFSSGDVSFAGGVRFTGSVGDESISFNGSTGTVKIGKLPTGESIAYVDNGGYDDINISGYNVSLAGGVDFDAGNGGSRLRIDSVNGKVSVGKLSTGESIAMNAGQDDDSLELTAANLKLSGGVNFVGGNGTNNVDFGHDLGVASIGKNAAGTSVTYAGGSGDDRLDLSSGSMNLAGAIEFTGFNGNNRLDYEAAPGSLKIGKGAGGTSILYSGGVDNDRIDFFGAKVTLAGGIDFSDSDGSNSIELDGDGGKLSVGKLTSGQSVLYTGGNGSDQITTFFNTVTFAGGIEFEGNNGNNFIQFNGTGGSVSVGKLGTGQSILYNGGADDDNIGSDMGLTSLAGGIEIIGGDGFNEVNFDGAGTLKLGALSSGESIKFTGGDDDDDVFIGGKSITLKGSVEIAGADGENTIDFDGANVNIGKTAAGISLLLTGGVGDDRIDLEDVINVAGDITLNGGAGENNMDLTQIFRLKVGGAVTFTGGVDEDTFDIDAFSLAITGGITFTGGAGTDDFFMFADGTVGGDVIANLGASDTGEQEAILESQTGTVGGLVLKGALTITSTGLAGSTDFVGLTNVNVAKAINATLGAGVSRVEIDNLQGGDLFALNTGDGFDVVDFERLDLLGNSVIKKLATIIMGAGDDTLLIGTPLALPGTGDLDSTRVRFLAGLTLDGGIGTDTRNDIASENTIDAPGVTGLGTFEVVV